MPNAKEIVINTTPILSLVAATSLLGMLPLLYRQVGCANQRAAHR